MPGGSNKNKLPHIFQPAENVIHDKKTMFTPLNLTIQGRHFCVTACNAMERAGGTRGCRISDLRLDVSF